MIKDINYKKQTKEEMVDAVSNIRILHPQINHAYKLVKYCHDSSGRKRKPELLFISGRSGMA